MTTPRSTRPLGSSGPSVFPLALGCMGMSGMYGPTDESESIATIHAALDAGVTLLDTGDFYGMGHNEMLLGRALGGRREKAFLSVKFGALRGPDGSWLGVDTRHAVHPVADLQIEYSLVSRGPEKSILPALRELKVGVTAYGVLSRGLLAGSKPAPSGDLRAHFPRFTGENRVRNDRLVSALAALASEKGATAPQVAIAWVLAKDPAVVPVIGARTRAQLAESLGALDVSLSPAEVARLEATVPAAAVAGTRYDEHQMRMLDSERDERDRFVSS
jgi:aryl-alcohol dehydrogenase-like predicted oxidoreductase